MEVHEKKLDKEEKWKVFIHFFLTFFLINYTKKNIN